MKIKEQFIEEIKKQYNCLLEKEKQIREKTIYQSKYEGQQTFSLQDIHINNEKKYQAKLQNIINSIPKIHKDKILLFKTITLNPKININLKTFNKNTIKPQYSKQNKTFKDYLREFRRIKNKDYIYIFEVTKNLTLHLHQVSYLNSIIEIKEYIKHAFIAKSKNPLIGRTELKFDYKQKEQILNLFENFTIKAYGKITLTPFIDKKTNERFYIIAESKIGAGNFIKIAFIEKQTNDDDKDKYIEKYLFKYLLKQKIKDTEDYVASLDSKVCKVCDINQLTYSEGFFSKNISSKTLFKLNDKLFNQYKYLADLNYDKKLNLYHTIELLNNGDIFLDNNIYYYKSKENLLLDLDSKYTKHITTSSFEALYNKYQDENSTMTITNANIYLATQMFFIYDYDKKEIFNEYGVDTIEDLADFFKLEQELYDEEQENERLRRLEELYEPICELDYHLHQITDDFIIEADIPVINLIQSKLENLQPTEPYQYF
jgi:hypothetical protein